MNLCAEILKQGQVKMSLGVPLEPCSATCTDVAVYNWSVYNCPSLLREPFWSCSGTSLPGSQQGCPAAGCVAELLSPREGGQSYFSLVQPLLEWEPCLEKLVPAQQRIFLFWTYFPAAPGANDAGRCIVRSTVAVICVNNYRNLCLLISD